MLVQAGSPSADACSKEQVMGEYTERVATVVAGALEPGERVIAASPGAPRGSMRAIAYGKGRSDRGARAALDAGRSELRAFGVPWAKQYVVVLSDRRLLWFRTSMFGRPKSVVASMVRGDVE